MSRPSTEHELPATTPGVVNIDHRKVTAFAPGDKSAYIRATWDQTPDVRIHIETVHRLSDLGAVVTHRTSGTSHEGFEAEWRGITSRRSTAICINHSELFDEADLDAALARFDELSRPAPRLENAASRVAERFWAHFAARDWDAMAEMLADDISSDDRRRVVNAGIRHGRDAEIADMRAVADLGITNVTSTVIATRGERLVLIRAAFTLARPGPEAFHVEILDVVEIDADDRIAARRRVRPRRHRRRLRGTRRPVPRRRSGRPRAHVVGHRAALSPRSTGTNSPRRHRTG